ncbi:MAG: aspartyl protease family protein [Nitrospirae bacterium]|nr:aspartyl protease family protein [Nitrospirota bacterium]
MGEIRVQVDLENFVDRYLCMRNKLPESAIREYSTTAIVDTGAVMLMLPRDVVEELDLTILRKVIVYYADYRRDELDVAGTVTIKIGKRFMNTDCLVGPPAGIPLIGQVILEELDLIADCQRRTLTPRPESPIYPMLMMK